MKSFLAVVLVAGYFVACAQAHPGLPRDDDSDTVLVLPELRNHYGMRSFDSSESDESVESWVPSFYNPFRSNPWDGFMSGMENALKRLRDQMAGLLSRIPDQGVGIWNKIPEGANTTSTTKVINGHVVTINETTYIDGDDEHGAVIRVRVIDVHPENATIMLTENETDAEVTTLPTSVTEKESTTAGRSVETVEEFDNEIPKNQVDTLTA